MALKWDDVGSRTWHPVDTALAGTDEKGGVAEKTPKAESARHSPAGNRP